MGLRMRIGGLLASLLAFSLLSTPVAEARHKVSHSKQHSKASRHSSHGKVSHSKKSRLLAKASKRHHRKHERVARVARVRPRQEIGALVLSESGETVLDQMSAMEMNPASAVKIITSYGALSNFGPDYRFTTSLYLDGAMDPGTGTFQGDLYVKGNDPEFDHKDAVELASELANAGIKNIDGKLIVEPSFSYRSCPNPLVSAKSLLKIWKGGTNRVTVRNGAAVGSVVETAENVGQVESETLRETLKKMMSYSQNNVAEQIGRTVGGVRKLEEIVSTEAGLSHGSIKLASASGLGQSRVKAKDMMLILKSLRTKLQTSGLDFQDIFPVAGIDPGTLDKRFTDASERGSVVAKTGTLPGTDGGTSSLVGMFRCQKEDLYFVIFCWKGSVSSFRNQQDNLIRQIQAKRGGPKAIPYSRQQAGGETVVN